MTYQFSDHEEEEIRTAFASIDRNKTQIGSLLSRMTANLDRGQVVEALKAVCEITKHDGKNYSLRTLYNWMGASRIEANHELVSEALKLLAAKSEDDEHTAQEWLDMFVETGRLRVPDAEKLVSAVKAIPILVELGYRISRNSTAV
jgi:hypothetical protein